MGYLRTRHGVGGQEQAFIRKLDYLAVGDRGVAGFSVDIGEADYGFGIDGILGMNFLSAIGAVIDLERCTLEWTPVDATHSV